jgi:hypothetical protein
MGAVAFLMQLCRKVKSIKCYTELITIIKKHFNDISELALYLPCISAIKNRSIFYLA